MKIYTLTIVYSDKDDEVYEIEETIDDELTYHEINGVMLKDKIKDELLMDKIRYEAVEIGEAWDITR